MKSCKDCMHYDVCEYWADKTNQAYYPHGSYCEYFKEIQIDVPIHIGGIVYILTNIDGIKSRGKEIIQCEVYKMSFKQDGKTIVYSCRGRYSSLGYYSGNFVFNSIGKTVFLTREEAEEALKNGVKINEKRNDKH